MVILAVLAWSPFTVGNWLSGLIVLTLVVVGIEALRRTSLTEDATTREPTADRAAGPADSGADAP